MSEERTKSDLRRIDEMKDEDIDYSDIPELDAEFFATARVVVPPWKPEALARAESRVDPGVQPAPPTSEPAK